MRVVIAEDEVLLREGLGHVLAGDGFDVVAAVGTLLIYAITNGMSEAKKEKGFRRGQVASASRKLSWLFNCWQARASRCINHH